MNEQFNKNKLKSEPKLDSRDYHSILAEINSLVPFYLPEWDSHKNNDVGQTLCKVYSHIQEHVIEKINKIPDHNFLEFLNIIGTNLSAKHPANVPVTMYLSNGVTKNVLVPKKTKVSSKATDSHDELEFSTLSDMLVTPSKLKRVFSALPKNNDVEIYDHTDNLMIKNSFSFFNGKDLQEHILCLGDDDLFNLEHNVKITIRPIPSSSNDDISQTQKIIEIMSDPSLVAWEYNWLDSKTNDPINASKFHFFRQGNTIVLEKKSGQINPFSINNTKSKWIRCKLLNSVNKKLALLCPKVSSFEVNVQTIKGQKITPDLLFHNDFPLPRTKPIYPFGQNPTPADYFYVSCGEVFSKKNSKVLLETKIDSGSDKENNSPFESYHNLGLFWEYWNGNGWSLLEWKPSEKSAFTIEFVTPNDLTVTSVNGHEGHWIRGRMASLSFIPRTKVIHKENEFDIQYEQKTLPKITINFSYSTIASHVSSVPKYCIAYNNLQYDYIGDLSDTIRPFKTLDISTPSVFLGFDKNISGGPINLFFSIDEKNEKTRIFSEIECYCKNISKWKKLDIVDNTQGMTKSGSLQMIFPSDFVKSFLFDDLYWIMLYDISQSYDYGLLKCKINGIHPNTVESSHLVNIVDELLGTSDYSPNQKFKLKNLPLSDTPISLWVNESHHVYDEEKKSLKKQNKIFSSYVETSPDDLWIQWEEVENFSSSLSSDRHFVLDRAMGVVHFGNGIHGKIPPVVKDNLYVDYVTGGGSIGNIDKNEIDSLKGSVPFVSAVTNPIAAGGGSDIENLAEAIKRGPKVLKNRRRAVALDDYEWIIRERFSSVKKIACLENIDVSGKPKPGKITIAVVPSSYSDMPTVPVKLLQEIQKYVSDRCLMTISKYLQVVGPKYLSISVTAEIFPVSIDQTQNAKTIANEQLKKFFHPVNGGYENFGWSFGMLPGISDVYRVLEEIPQIAHVSKVSFSLSFVDTKEKYTVDSDDKLSEVPIDGLTLVCNGYHKLISRWEKQ